MILFLNFAPISFMGGAEKVMLEYAHAVSKKEKVYLMDVSSKIANIYGSLVLKRSFKSHINDHHISDIQNHISLNFSSFIPFAKDWKATRQLFTQSRLIYTRFEFLEILLCIYFGGFGVFAKTIAGMHLTPIYASPRGFVDQIHNLLYGSFIYKFFLNKVKRIHVITERDKKIIQSHYKITNNLIVLPIGIEVPDLKMFKSTSKTSSLKIMFAGELSTRKGVDSLIDIIQKSPAHFEYHIVGDGPLKNAVKDLNPNCKLHYHGYVSSRQLSDLYTDADLLLFPSRAEAFGIVMAEAISYGAMVVNSSEVTLDLPYYIERTVDDRQTKKYLNALDQIHSEKLKNQISKNKIHQFALNNYSKEKINSKFLSEVIQL